MAPFSNYWRGAILAGVPVLTFVPSYFTIFESTRTGPGNGFNMVLLLGGPVFVGIVSGVMLQGLAATAPEQNLRARRRGWIGGLIVGLTYFGLMMFLTVNTIGS
jgi:hypothetical protein